MSLVDLENLNTNGGAAVPEPSTKQDTFFKRTYQRLLPIFFKATDQLKSATIRRNEETP